jgi:nucleoid-associated protein YejK
MEETMNEELKSREHYIRMKGFVIHRITKRAGKIVADLKLAKKEIIPTDRERKFIAIVSEAYYKRSAPTYGIFDDSESNIFKDELVLYHKKKQDFYTFSCKCMQRYKDIIKDVAPATGGFIVFSHYDNTFKKTEFLLIIAVNNKDGFMFNEEKLILEDIKNIELNKIDLACSVNLTKWNEFQNENNQEIQTFLSFNKGNKDLSAYFMKFIGCANKTTSTESSKRLVRALTQFC